MTSTLGNNCLDWTVGYFMRHQMQGIMLCPVSRLKRQSGHSQKLKDSPETRDSLKVCLNHHQESSSGYLLHLLMRSKLSLLAWSLVGMDSWTYLLNGFGILSRSLWSIWLVFGSVLTVCSPWRLDRKSILTMKYPTE